MVRVVLHLEQAAPVPTESASQARQRSTLAATLNLSDGPGRMFGDQGIRIAG
jgi:hypothetical protein